MNAGRFNPKAQRVLYATTGTRALGRQGSNRLGSSRSWARTMADRAWPCFEVARSSTSRKRGGVDWPLDGGSRTDTDVNGWFRAPAT
jgi:hypothetical protein